MTEVLVAGYKGFIGSKIYHQLQERWYTVKPYIGDIANISAEVGNPHVIINAAGEITNQSRMLHANVVGVEALTRYCLERQIKLIHLSSGAVKGDSYYGLTKKMGEELIFNLAPKDWLILRLTNVYSPKEGDSPAARFERGEREIFGKGEALKDLVHVNDVVEAVLMGIYDNWGGVVNIATGQALTINEIFAKFGTGKPHYQPRKRAEEILLDNSTALSLGWKPKWSALK